MGLPATFPRDRRHRALRRIRLAIAGVHMACPIWLRLHDSGTGTAAFGTTPWIRQISKPLTIAISRMTDLP